MLYTVFISPDFYSILFYSPSECEERKERTDLTHGFCVLPCVICSSDGTGVAPFLLEFFEHRFLEGGGGDEDDLGGVGCDGWVVDDGQEV